MPVRSLTSAVFKWPDREQVLSAAREWARTVHRTDAGIRSVCCVGSYARGDWGVGSDLDLVIVVGSSDLPFERRPARFDTAALPVQSDVWVYTAEEWSRLPEQSPQVWRRWQREALDLLQPGCT